MHRIDSKPGREGSRRRVCFVQSYREPGYVRGRAIQAALAGSDDVQLVLAVNCSRGIRRYWETLRALLHARRQFDPDVYILGFRGHELAWLVRWLTRRKPLVIDALMSPYAAMAEEGKLGMPGRLVAPLWRRYEAAILHAADAVLTDTQLHADFLQARFRIPARKIFVIPVGAVEHEELPENSSLTATESHHPAFRVLFYGSFLPLHGVDTIVDAAARVGDLPVEFDFIGGTPTQARQLHALCATRGVRRYRHRDWVPFDQLLQHDIPRADLCLGGPFGNTPQARRVVTGKTSQCLALGKPTVVGRIDEDWGFVHKVNCLLVEQGDAAQLATAIRWSHGHPAELAAIGQRGQLLYARRLSTAVIVQRLLPLMRGLTRQGPGT